MHDPPSEHGFVLECMRRIARSIDAELIVEGYEFATKPTRGPIVFVTVRGAAEDATTARKVREQLERIVAAAVPAELRPFCEPAPRVYTYNRGDDLLVQCEVILT